MEHAQIAINNVQMRLAQFMKTALEVGYACNYFKYFQILPPLRHTDLGQFSTLFYFQLANHRI